MQFCSHGSSNNSTTPLRQGLSFGYTLLPEARRMLLIPNGITERHFASLVFLLLLALLTMKSNQNMAVRFFLQLLQQRQSFSVWKLIHFTHCLFLLCTIITFQKDLKNITFYNAVPYITCYSTWQKWKKFIWLFNIGLILQKLSFLNMTYLEQNILMWNFKSAWLLIKLFFLNFISAQHIHKIRLLVGNRCPKLRTLVT